MGNMPTRRHASPKRFCSPGASFSRKASLTSAEQSTLPTSFQIARFSSGSRLICSGKRSSFVRVPLPSSVRVSFVRPDIWR